MRHRTRQIDQSLQRKTLGLVILLLAVCVTFLVLSWVLASTAGAATWKPGTPIGITVREASDYLWEHNVQQPDCRGLKKDRVAPKLFTRFSCWHEIEYGGVIYQPRDTWRAYRHWRPGFFVMEML